MSIPLEEPVADFGVGKIEALTLARLSCRSMLKAMTLNTLSPWVRGDGKRSNEDLTCKTHAAEKNEAPHPSWQLDAVTDLSRLTLEFSSPRWIVSQG